MYNQNISKIKNWEVNINASPWYNSTNKDRDTAFISSLPSPQLTLFTSHSFSFAALSLSLSFLTFYQKGGKQKKNGMHNGNGAREEGEEANEKYFMENQKRD